MCCCYIIFIGHFKSTAVCSLHGPSRCGRRFGNLTKPEHRVSTNGQISVQVAYYISLSQQQTKKNIIVVVVGYVLMAFHIASSRQQLKRKKELK
jgi:hypothetical protein